MTYIFLQPHLRLFNLQITASYIEKLRWSVTIAFLSFFTILFTFSRYIWKTIKCILNMYITFYIIYIYYLYIWYSCLNIYLWLPSFNDRSNNRVSKFIVCLCVHSVKIKVSDEDDKQVYCRRKCALCHFGLFMHKCNAMSPTNRSVLCTHTLWHYYPHCHCKEICSKEIYVCMKCLKPICNTSKTEYFLIFVCIFLGLLLKTNVCGRF